MELTTTGAEKYIRSMEHLLSQAFVELINFEQHRFYSGSPSKEITKKWAEARRDYLKSKQESFLRYQTTESSNDNYISVVD